MIKYLKILSTILLLFPLWGQGGYLFAQNYPVQCTPILTPPYTLSWVEYGSSPERLKVQLLLKDLTKPSVEVSLRIKLKGIGVVIENTPDFYTSSPITLLPGVPVMISGAMLRENFMAEHLTAQGVDLNALYTGQSLAGGFYTWEITAFLADQRQVSNVGMAMMTVFKNNPPLITFPQNNAVLMNTGFQSINFTWMPRHRYSTNAAAGTIYTFKIYEIPTEGDPSEETDPNVIVNSGVLPLFSTQTFGTNYLYKSSDPVLIPGRKYAIQVQAGDINGADEFENNGFSEVSTFTFGKQGEAPAVKPCKKPSDLLVEKLDEQSVQLTWQESNTEAPIDYIVNYKAENEGVWTEKIMAETKLILLQLAPANYQFKVSARCTYENRSPFTPDENIELSKPVEEIPEADPIITTEDTYTNTDPEPQEPAVYEPEPEHEPAIDELNTPIKILLDPADEIGTQGTGTPTNPNIPKGYEDLTNIPVLPTNPTLEQLKTALKTNKVDCSALLANYQCGQNEILSVPSGDIIQVKTGDEIAINSIAFEVVDLDGSGNGRGIVKVPMFNNAKFGVDFKGIKVAKGGCVVEGQAELSNVDVSILNEEQRKKLAETYQAFNKVLDVVDANAEGVAETFNSVWDLMNSIKDRAAKIAAKLSAGQNPSAKEIKDLAKLTENSAAMLQKSLNDIKKQAQANADAGKVDEMQKIIDQQKASAKALLEAAKDIKTGTDNQPSPQDPAAKADTQNQVDALALTNGEDVKKKLDGLKGTSNLMIEYNKVAYANGKTITISNKEAVSGFTLKNVIEGEDLAWVVKDGDKVLNNFTANPVGLMWPEGKTKLTLEASQGEKKISLTLQRKTFAFTDLIAIDSDNTTRKAYSSKNETLYIVRSPLSSRTVNYKMTTNASTNDFEGTEPTWNTTFPKGGLYEGEVLTKSNSSTAETRHTSEASGITSATAFDKSYGVKVKVVDKDYSGNVIVKEFPFASSIVKLLDYSDIVRTYIPGVKTYNNRKEFLQDDAYKGFKLYIEPKAERNSLNLEWGASDDDKNEYKKGSERLFYKRTTTVGQVAAGIKWEKEFPVPNLGREFKQSFWGQEIKINFGLFVKPTANASGEIGITKKEYEWVEKTNLNSTKTTIDPARFIITGGLFIVPKGEVKIASIGGGLIGETGVTAELLLFDIKDGLKNAKVEYPIFEKGFKYSLEVKAYAEWHGYKYEHIFDKIEGEYTWKK